MLFRSSRGRRTGPARAQIAALILGALCAAQGFAAPADIEDWERHIQELRDLSVREPGLPNHHLALAEAHSQIGDSTKVEEHCYLALQLGAHPARVAALLAEHYLRLNRFDRALEHALRAQAKGPRSAALHGLLWRILLEMARAPGASAQVNPVLMQQALGLLSARGYYVPAPLRQPGAGLVEDPVTARSYLAQGYQSLQGGQLEPAMQSFLGAADVAPTLADAYRGIGIVEARLRHTDRALAAYQLFLALAPERSPDRDAVERIVLDFYQQGAARP